MLASLTDEPNGIRRAAQGPYPDLAIMSLSQASHDHGKPIWPRILLAIDSELERLPEVDHDERTPGPVRVVGAGPTPRHMERTWIRLSRQWDAVL